MALEILVIDKNYIPHRWVSVEQAIILEAKNNVINHLGEAIFIYHGGNNHYTGEQSILKTSSIIMIAGAPNLRKYKEPTLTNSSLFIRDRLKCCFCERVYRSVDLTCDHIHPISKGGKDIWINVVTACKSCNSVKSDTIVGQRLPNGELGPQGTGFMIPIYNSYVPSKAEHLIMKVKAIKADQLEFLINQISNKDVSRIYKDFKNEQKIYH